MIVEESRLYHFYASSLLLAYEMEKVERNEFQNEIKDKEKFTVIVKWVDFTRVMDSNGESDENFIFGLKKLIDLMEKVTRETEKRLL